jgi:uncharacterized protein YkwD
MNDAFMKSMLAEANAHRAAHGAPPLAWSTGLAGDATSWAGRCALEVDMDTRDGENLFATVGNNVQTALNFALATW